MAISNYLSDIFAIFDHVALFFMSPPVGEFQVIIDVCDKMSFSFH